ncbi:mRNA 3'-end-processing protein rna14 [Friedmanniomyces endolithicus]|uniref:mRNA 3'-end-processing protein RNA14 n=1 Tax=Friedmanniomyces endolithicus TaxID=329885 RepID=A0AAN6QJW2_9PEZI|nr:mRNA 3'-end-processing protein rna14 [Friedmanniomyces endolithicus]KAK0965038.1 mRNA 3'-end-processing protein rna14 [Friedmanniomyces endolithicus]KAK0967581.1 mRNA 3'-end-processing protein rna14 [Friedmanniomyces endolithicus]KAK1029635.1 mRNA 3'-end-processing protein rna14 [Friedmanniomyces endolithicus]
MAAYAPDGLPDLTEEQPPQTNGDHNYDQQEGGDEDEDYDPSSFNFGDGATEKPGQHIPSALGATSAAPQYPQQEQVARPKTVGGFIMEESDDDDDDDEEEDSSMSGAPPPPSQLNGTEGAQSGLGAVAVHEAAGEDVQLASEPTQDSAAAQQLHADSLNGSTAFSTMTTTTPLPTDAVQSTIAPAESQPALSLTTAQHDEGKQAAISPTADAGPVSVAATSKPSVINISAPSDSSAVLAAPTTQRLPHDKVGRLEDRIKEDPKADVEAWWELIHHYRDKDQLDNARRVFDRMLEVWPTSPTIYLQYLALEHEAFDRSKIDPLFGNSLPIIPSLPLWTEYLSYLRRVFPLIPDPQGVNRTTITSAFEHVIGAVGNDPDSANLWRDYVDFVKSGHGVFGGTGWQDMQKVDALRKAYQQAVKVPTGGVMALWKEYDAFEMQQNKGAARKTLQEMSPHYMTARTAEKQMQAITDGLDRRVVPTLPPVEGYEGDDAFAAQVQRWQAWVEWEKSDPLVLREDDIALYRKRITFVYKQATIFLRFWPRIWYDAAQWCFEQVGAPEDMMAQGEAFLDDGLKANPESVLLTLKKVDRSEEGMQTGNVADEVMVANGNKLEAVFEPCHKALYDLVKKTTQRRDKAVAEVKQNFASLPPEEEAEQVSKEDDDNDSLADADSPLDTLTKPLTRAEQLQARIKSIQDPTKAHHKLLIKTVSALWIAKMRSFRRVQGQGAPLKAKKGFRGVFAESRPRGQLSSDVYIASALMEHHCYKDVSALKIFERGLKLFPTDEEFAVGYVGHLISVNDLTNARVVFETTVTKILGATKQFEEGERKGKVGVLLRYMHRFESAYGDLAQVRKLEVRLRELVPESDGGVGAREGREQAVFAERFEMRGFDALGVQLVLSGKQVRAKNVAGMITMPDGGRVPMPMPMPMQAQMPAGLQEREDGAGSALRLGPNGPFLGVASPKRPLDEDTDGEGPRKYMRSDSPLKGGRRGAGHAATNSVSNSASGNGGMGGGGGFAVKNFVPGHMNNNNEVAATGAPPMMTSSNGNGYPPAPPSLPNQVSLLLQVLPSASSYRAHIFDAGRMVDLLRGVDVEGARGRFR